LDGSPRRQTRRKLEFRKTPAGTGTFSVLCRVYAAFMPRLCRVYAAFMPRLCLKLSTH
jgi:hypothetical protein